MTREPEMVQAYRDTWEFGNHSYLLICEIDSCSPVNCCMPQGSIFVQIGDKNFHHVRELMDEVFGKPIIFAVLSRIQKPPSTTGDLPPSTVNDLSLWYFRDVERVTFVANL